MATMAIGIISNALLTRLLSPEEVGAYFLCISILVFSTLLGELGLTRTAVRYIATSLANHQYLQTRIIIYQILTLGLVGSIVVALFYNLLVGEWLATRVFYSPLMNRVISITALLIIVTSMLDLLVETIRGFQDIKLAATLKEFLKSSIATFLLIAIWMIKDKSNIEQVMIVTTVATGVSAVIAAKLVYNKVERLSKNFQLRIQENHSKWTNLINTAGILLITDVFLYTLNNANLWILGMHENQSQVALYGAAFRLVALTSVPLLVVNAVVPPIIAELYSQGKKIQLEQMLRGIALLSSIPAFCSLILFIYVGKLLLSWIYGGFYQDAYLVLIILSLGQLVNVTAGSCGNVLMMTGRESIMMSCTIVSGVVTLLLSFSLVTSYGAVGVAMAATVGMILQNMFMLYFVKREVGIWTLLGYSDQLTIKVLQYKSQLLRTS